MTCLFPCPQWHRAGQLDSAGWCSIAWQLFPASVACCDTLPLFHSLSQSRQNISWHGIWMHLAIWRIESTLDGKAHIRYHGQKGTAKLFLIVFAKAFGFPVVPVVPGIALVFTWDTAARCCQMLPGHLDGATQRWGCGRLQDLTCDSPIRRVLCGFCGSKICKDQDWSRNVDQRSVKKICYRLVRYC